MYPYNTRPREIIPRLIMEDGSKEIIPRLIM